ncbi:MAG TPA: hypothetical protein VHV47_14570 [Opitutaceae bacterium]|nr:hypothetical protein [Opitutaceae bacterium]
MDKESVGQPVVQPHKRTTQVNIAQIILVVVFFALCAVGMVWLHHHSSDHRGNLSPSEQAH